MTISAGAAYGALCQVKMIYGGLVFLFTLFQFILKKIKKIEKCAPTLLCSRLEQKKKNADAPLPSNENLIKLRTLLSMYNPEHHSPQILSIYKDVWIKKIEDAYYGYNCSSSPLNVKEEELANKLVHDDVVKFVVTILNKSSLSVNQSASKMAASVIDVSSSDITSTSEDAEEVGIVSDDSNESSKCLETITESQPPIIEEAVPLSPVQSKAPVTVTDQSVSDKMDAYVIAATKATFPDKVDTIPEPGVEKAGDFAPVHSDPEVMPSPVLLHIDRGRSC